MKKFAIIAGLAALPSIASAQTLITVIQRVQQILNLVIPILITLALIYFFWGLGMYILNQSSEEKKEQGRSIMIWGVVALFVMVSVWGLVGLIGSTFNINSNPTITIPRVPSI